MKKSYFILFFLGIIINSLNAQSIQSFTLVDASTNSDISILQDGAEVSSSQSFTIRADVDGATSCVHFQVNGSDFQTENIAPYALAGDNNGDYNAWNVSTGTYTINAIPYSGDNRSGTTGNSSSITISIVDDNPDPTPVGDYDPGTGAVTVTGELKKWHKITLNIDGPNLSETTSPNPFYDFALYGKFSNGSNTYLVPGYYAADGNAANTSASSGNIWKIHFAPDATGAWNYEIIFKEGAAIAISDQYLNGTAVPGDGNIGSFSIGNSDKSGKDFRSKGRIKYTGKRYLQFAETQELYLKGGADSPENLLAYQDFDGTYNNGGTNYIKSYQPHVGDFNSGDPTWQSGKGKGLIGALNYLSSKGMNSIYFLTMNVNGDGNDVWPWTSPSERYRFDVSKLDQWELVFDHAEKQGIALHVITQETENDQLLDVGSLGNTRKLYYRELIARFGHHLGLFWNLGEENTNTDQQRKDFANFIRKLDAYDHFISIHTYPGQKDNVYTPLLGFTNLDGTSLQMGSMTSTNTETKKWIDQSNNSGKQWVVNLDEIGPAGTGVAADADYSGNRGSQSDNQDQVRYYALWGNLMAGGGGAEWYFGYQTGETDLTCEDWRSRDKMWDYTRYALEFFHKYLKFETMHANNGLTSSPDDYVFAEPGKAYAIYLPYGGTTDLDVGTTSNNYKVEWYNPRSGGNLLNGSTTSISGSGQKNIGYPPADTNKDWVALITISSTSPTEQAILNVTPSTVDFGPLYLGNSISSDLILENTGNISLEVNDITLSNTEDFNYAANLPISLDPGSTVNVTVTFDPVTSGSKSASLTINHTGDNSPNTMPLSGAAVEESNPSSVIALNSGGGDLFNDGFTKDNYYTSSNDNIIKNDINNSSNDALYQAERFGKSFAYNIPITNGNYQVKLHFAEIYWKEPGRRIFDVSIEGQLVLDNFDIYQEVGANFALIKIFPALVQDGELNIEFFTSVDNAKISGVEVIPENTENNPPSITVQESATIYENQIASLPVLVDDTDSENLTLATVNLPDFASLTFDGISTGNIGFAPVSGDQGIYEVSLIAEDGSGGKDSTGFVLEVLNSQESTAIRINAGGAAYEVDGIIYDEDNHFTNGRTATHINEINNSEKDKLYHTERYGGTINNPMIYSIPVPNNECQIILHFAEIYWNEPGKRVFDVSVNGNLVLDDLDIYQEVGKNHALIKSFNTKIQNEQIMIELAASINYGKLSAIEILPAFTSSTAARKKSSPNNLNPELSSLITLYPNPVSEQLNLNFGGLEIKEIMQVRLFDVNGNELWRDENPHLSNKQFQLNLTPLDLKDGVYILNVKAGKLEQKFRFLKN